MLKYAFAYTLSHCTCTTSLIETFGAPSFVCLVTQVMGSKRPRGSWISDETVQYLRERRKLTKSTIPQLEVSKWLKLRACKVSGLNSVIPHLLLFFDTSVPCVTGHQFIFYVLERNCGNGCLVDIATSRIRISTCHAYVCKFWNNIVEKTAIVDITTTWI